MMMNKILPFESKEEALSDLQSQYLKPSKPLAFAGISAIQNYYGGLLNEKDIRQFLSKQYTYTKSREFHRPFPRNPVFCYRARDLIEIDLIQLTPEIAKPNKANFILTAIDVFTRKIWAEMVKTKSAKDIVPVFEDILHEMTEGPSGKIPEAILADRGLEWLNKSFKGLLEKHKVKLFHNFTSYKASHVERVQRTLQKKIYSFLTSRGKLIFADRLQEFVDGYNSSYHRMIKM